MGIKPVYRLTTASGRSIKTTINHPYLVRNQKPDPSCGWVPRRKQNLVSGYCNLVTPERSEGKWLKVKDLKEGDEIGVPKEINGRVFPLSVGDNYKLNPALQSKLQKGQLSFPYLVTSLLGMDEERSNNKYYCQNTKTYSQHIWELFKDISGQPYARNCLTQISYSLSDKLLLVFSNLHRIALYHIIVDLSRFMERSAYAEVEASPQIDSSNSIVYSKDKINEPITKNNEPASEAGNIVALPLAHSSSLIAYETNSDVVAQSTFALQQVDNGKGFGGLFAEAHTIYCNFKSEGGQFIGQFIGQRSSDIMWDKIVSIEYCGYEHVYDIEVEGTHNFIGNGIFAHNTSISPFTLAPSPAVAKDINDLRSGLPLYHVTTVELYESKIKGTGLKPRKETGSDSLFEGKKTSLPDYIYLGNDLGAIWMKAGATSKGAKPNKDHLAVLLNVNVPDVSRLTFDEDWRNYFTPYLIAWIEYLNREIMTIALPEARGTRDINALKRNIQLAYHLSNEEMEELSRIIEGVFRESEGDFYEIYKAIVTNLNFSLRFGRSIAYEETIDKAYITNVRYVVQDEIRYLVNFKKFTNGEIESYLDLLYTLGYDGNKFALVFNTHREKIMQLREGGLIDQQTYERMEAIADSRQLSEGSELEIGILEIVRRFSDMRGRFSLNLAKLAGIIAIVKGPSDVDELFARLLVERTLIQDKGIGWDRDFIEVRDSHFEWDYNTAILFFELSKHLSEDVPAKGLLSVLRRMTLAERKAILAEVEGSKGESGITSFGPGTPAIDQPMDTNLDSLLGYLEQAIKEFKEAKEEDERKQLLELLTERVFALTEYLQTAGQGEVEKIKAWLDNQLKQSHPSWVMEQLGVLQQTMSKRLDTLRSGAETGLVRYKKDRQKTEAIINTLNISESDRVLVINIDEEFDYALLGNTGAKITIFDENFERIQKEKERRRQFENIKFQAGAPQTERQVLPYFDHTFDKVILNLSIDFQDEAFKFLLQEIIRITYPDSTLLINLIGIETISIERVRASLETIAALIRSSSESGISVSQTENILVVKKSSPLFILRALSLRLLNDYVRRLRVQRIDFEIAGLHLISPEFSQDSVIPAKKLDIGRVVSEIQNNPDLIVLPDPNNPSRIINNSIRKQSQKWNRLLTR